MSLERELVRRISAEQNPLERAVLRAELSSYVARMGRFDEASALIAQLREEGVWNSSRLSALTMLAEAHVALRSEYNKAALERLSKGFAISSGFGDFGAAALLAAWLAQFAYNHAELGQLRKWVSACRDLRVHMGSQARVRFSLTQASIGGYLGDKPAADAWYRIARSGAVAEQDEASLAAAMFNRPALAISRARVAQALGLPDGAALDSLVMEIESGESYARATRNRAVVELQRFWRARALMLRGDAVAAGAELERCLEVLPEASATHVRDSILSDLATCAMELGDQDRLMHWIAKLPRSIDNEMQTDDQVVFFGQVARVFECAQIADKVAAARAELERASLEYDSYLEELRNCLVEPSDEWSVVQALGNRT